MAKAVIDTNIFVSVLYGKPATASLLDYLLEQRFIIVSSTRQIEELLNVLARPKLAVHLNSDDVMRLIHVLKEAAELVEPAFGLKLCRDPDDDYLLDIAATARADFLVTGDKDLLDDSALRQTMLAGYGVKVITISEFLRRV
jgi:putative PIN family toxin of toxin-antitoxin system